MAVQGCGGQGFVRLRTMLHVEGGEIVRFLSCGGVGHVEGGAERDRFSCGEGREKR